ncbi:MAG: Cna B-type domain-containing protein [Lachnospiraceae bacterium]|nr:Cna B-type domain-containing protein [Lachnospiraceae bacterium]
MLALSGIPVPAAFQGSLIGGAGGKLIAEARAIGEKNKQACDICRDVNDPTKAPAMKDYSSYVAGISDLDDRIDGVTYDSNGYSTTEIQYEKVIDGVYRGGNSATGLQGADLIDDDPKDFANVLPYGNTYIDASKLAWTDATSGNFIVDIPATSPFKWVGGANYANVRDKNNLSPDTDPMENQKGLAAGTLPTICYVGRLDGYLSNPTDQSKPSPAVPSQSSGNSNTIKASDLGLEYLYQLTYIGAATLKDGTKGNLVLTVDRVEIETTLTYGKALVRIQEANELLSSLSTTYEDGSVINTSAYTAKTAEEVEAAVQPGSGWNPSHSVDKEALGATGAIVDLDIKVTDAEGYKAAGTISYAASDMDFENYQDLWGRSMAGEDRYKFNEGMLIVSGSKSYAVTPYYDHAHADTVAEGWIPDINAVLTGTDGPKAPLRITRPNNVANKGNGPADGVRFTGLAAAVVRDKNGTFANALFAANATGPNGKGQGMIVSKGTTPSGATNTNVIARTNDEVAHVAVRRQLYGKILDASNQPVPVDEITLQQALAHLGEGSYSTRRNDAGGPNSFDTGFAVLLDASGAKLRWSGSCSNLQNASTVLFDTTIFTEVEVTHGTGGGIYFESYEVGDDCAVTRLEGVATMGKGLEAVVTVVPEDGYRVKTIMVGGEGLSNPKTYDVENLPFTGNQYVDDANGLTIEKNADGTYDVIFKSVTDPRHVHADFTADYYFYKVWKGKKEPTSLNMTATPYAFVFQDVTIADTKYKINNTPGTDAEGAYSHSLTGGGITWYVRNNAVTIDDGTSAKTYYLRGNTFVHYDRTDPDNPVVDGTYNIRLDYVQKGDPVAFTVAREDAENTEETHVLQEIDADGYKVWRIRYPSEGCTTKSGKEWKKLAIETPVTAHNANHVERLYWFATEEAPGWSLVEYDNGTAKAPGRIESSEARKEVYYEGDSGELSAWASASTKDYKQAEEVIESAADNDHAYMSVFYKKDNDTNNKNLTRDTWGGEIVNVPAVVVSAEKIWDDFDNKYRTRRDVWFHIDSTDNDVLVKDILPPQKLAADASAFTLNWGDKKAYGAGDLSDYRGEDYRRTKVVGKASEIPTKDGSDNPLYYIQDEKDPHKYLPFLVDGTDAEGKPNYVPDEKGITYYVNELADLNGEAGRVTYSIRETDVDGNDLDKTNTGKFLKGYTTKYVDQSGAEVKDGKAVRYGEQTMGVDGVPVSWQRAYVRNTLVGEGSITVKKEWNDDDNRDGKRKAFTVRLYRQGADGVKQPTDEAPATVPTDRDGMATVKDGATAVTWEKLPVWENGQKITYSVVEENNGSDYTARVSESAVELELNQTKEITITNEHTPDQTKLTIQKIWEDEDDRYGLRPESIHITVSSSWENAETREEETEVAAEFDLTETGVSAPQTPVLRAIRPRFLAPDSTEESTEEESVLLEEEQTVEETTENAPEDLEKTEDASDTAAEATGQEEGEDVEPKDTEAQTEEQRETEEPEAEAVPTEEDETETQEQKTESAETAADTETEQEESDPAEAGEAQEPDQRHAAFLGQRAPGLYSAIQMLGGILRDTASIQAEPEGSWPKVTVSGLYEYKKVGAAVTHEVTEVAVPGYETTITNENGMIKIINSIAPPIAEPEESLDYKGRTQTGKPSFKANRNTTGPGGEENKIERITLLDENGEEADSVTVPGEGTYSLNEDGTVTFTPEPDFVGQTKGVRVRGFDSNGLSADTTYTPTVIVKVSYVDPLLPDGTQVVQDERDSEQPGGTDITTTYEDRPGQRSAKHPGYRFDGWEETIDPDDPSHYIRTAKYTALHIIIYDPHGGSGTMEENDYAADADTKNAMENTFTRQGHTFTGFYAYITDPTTGQEALLTDAGGNPLVFTSQADMSEYFKGMPPGTTIRMEAQWKMNPSDRHEQTKTPPAADPVPTDPIPAEETPVPVDPMDTRVEINRTTGDWSHMRAAGAIGAVSAILLFALLVRRRRYN